MGKCTENVFKKNVSYKCSTKYFETYDIINFWESGERSSYKKLSYTKMHTADQA